MSGQGESLSIITPYILSIYRKNIGKKNPDTSIIRKQHIQEPVNPRKRAKENTLTDVEKVSPKETPPSFQHKVNYKGDTNDKTRGSDNSPTETDACVRNLSKEHENEEDEEFK